MFNRFTRASRQVVVAAQTEARRMGSDAIDTEHLLLGMLTQPGTEAARVLREVGVTTVAVEDRIQRAMRRGGLGDQDVEALEAIGIRPDDILREMEAAFGEGALKPADGSGPGSTGHLPFSDRAKKVLERTLREALDVRSNSLGTEHMLLALVSERNGLAADTLHTLGVSPDSVREKVLALLRQAS